jgi:hypothetical protein
MQCAVCGQDHGLTHTCTGIAPLKTAEETAPPPRLRFAPVHYINEAVKILSWDEAAVRRASKDNNSLLYGFLIVAIAPALPLGALMLRDVRLGYPVPWELVISRYGIALLGSLIWIVLQIGLSHILAKALFEAKGSYVEIMRAYLLGQLYRWLIVVPIVGGLALSVGSIAVLMLVFEEVHGIERMKAFGLAASIGVIFWIASIWLSTPGAQPIR